MRTPKIGPLVHGNSQVGASLDYLEPQGAGLLNTASPAGLPSWRSSVREARRRGPQKDATYCCSCLYTHKPLGSKVPKSICVSIVSTANLFWGKFLIPGHLGPYGG